MADAHKRWGRIDILHNNVGVSISGGDAELLEITEESFDRCVAINLKSCILACKHVIPIMRAQKSGAIVNISSMAVITTYPYVAYKATKAAMVSFTEQLAYQNAEYGIRANVILPGLMNTPMAVDTRAREFKKSRAQVEAERDSKVPLRRKMGTGWDVANAALFLASDEANFITGVTLPVDGGASVNGLTAGSMAAEQWTRDGFSPSGHRMRKYHAFSQQAAPLPGADSGLDAHRRSFSKYRAVPPWQFRSSR